MQLIKIASDFMDYEVVSNDPLFLDKITQTKQKQDIGVKENEIINETIIRTFTDGEIYAWCDDIFGYMKIMDN